jgi:hypothetical protein
MNEGTKNERKRRGKKFERKERDKVIRKKVMKSENKETRQERI